jgi:hypothetical protein
MPQEEARAERNRSFRPHIQLLIDFQPQPWFTAQIILAECTIPVPGDTRNLPFIEELSMIISKYKEYLTTLSFNEQVAGFRYYRDHEFYLEFDKNFKCTEISSSQTYPKQPKPFGNKMIDMLTNSQNGGAYAKISEFS